MLGETHQHNISLMYKPLVEKIRHRWEQARNINKIALSEQQFDLIQTIHYLVYLKYEAQSDTVSFKNQEISTDARRNNKLELEGVIQKDILALYSRIGLDASNDALILLCSDIAQRFVLKYSIHSSGIRPALASVKTFAKDITEELFYFSHFHTYSNNLDMLKQQLKNEIHTIIHPISSKQ